MRSSRVIQPDDWTGHATGGPSHGAPVGVRVKIDSHRLLSYFRRAPSIAAAASSFIHTPRPAVAQLKSGPASRQSADWRSGGAADERGVATKAPRRHLDGICHRRNPHRAGARPGYRRHCRADLSDFDVRAGGAGQEQGLRLRAHKPSQPQGAGTLRGTAGRRAVGVRFHDGHGGDRRGVSPVAPGRPRHYFGGGVRGRVPADHAVADAVRAGVQLHRYVERGECARGDSSQHQDDLCRDADQPHDDHHRHRRDGPDRRRAPADAGGGQHVSQSLPAAADFAGRAHRGALDDQVFERAQRCRWAAR